MGKQNKTNSHGRQSENQRKSRRRRLRSYCEVKKQQLKYELIDGNMSYYPYGYCEYYQGWLTLNLSKIHNCEGKCCSNFVSFESLERARKRREKRKKQELKKQRKLERLEEFRVQYELMTYSIQKFEDD
jgi:hypothetical protein